MCEKELSFTSEDFNTPDTAIEIKELKCLLVILYSHKTTFKSIFGRLHKTGKPVGKKNIQVIQKCRSWEPATLYLTPLSD